MSGSGSWMAERIDSVIVNRRSSVDADALVASVVSTCQAKLSSSGGVGLAEATADLDGQLARAA